MAADRERLLDLLVEIYVGAEEKGWGEVEFLSDLILGADNFRAAAGEEVRAYLDRFLRAEPAPLARLHVGLPVDPADVLDRASRGLPTYTPTDPKDLTREAAEAYLAFADKRGPNSE